MKNLSARLQRMEAQSCNILTDAALQLLVDLTARLDALFWPHRLHKPYRPEVRKMQRDYLHNKAGLRAAASGETNWKGQHLARKALIEAGLCSACTAGGQITGLRLTEQGLSDARALIGDRLLSISACLPLLKEIQQQATDEWISESRLFGVELTGSPTQWEPLIDVCLPLLRAGLIEQNSDLWGRCYFRSCPAVEVPNEPASQLSVAYWADAAYLDAFASERAHLEQMVSTDSGIVVPIRCT